MTYWDEGDEYLQVDITSPADVTPSTVEVAAVPAGLDLDDDTTWHAAELITGGAQILHGDGGLGLQPGTYTLYVRITAPPETPIRMVGPITIR